MSMRSGISGKSNGSNTQKALPYNNNNINMGNSNSFNK